VGLHIAQDPFGGHDRMAGQSDVFGKSVGRFLQFGDVDRQRLATENLPLRDKKTVLAAQIKLSPGATNKHRPAISAN
jgi:hypothetical protein